MIAWRRRRVIRLAAEFTTVLFGIVSALAIDRWAQRRDDASTERYYLRSLASDFRMNRRLGKSGIRLHENAAANAGLVVRAGELGKPLITFDSLARAVEFSGWTGRFDFDSSTWDDLLATGKISLIRDDTLREAIRRFYSRAAQLHYFEDEWNSYKMAYRTASIGLLAPAVRLRIFGERVDSDTLSLSGDASALQEQLRRNVVVMSRATDVLMTGRVGQVIYGQVVSAIDSISTRIAEDLKKSEVK